MAGETGSRFIVGLDLGQSQDYTALCVAECLRVGPLPPGYRPATDFADAWHRSAYDGRENLMPDPRPRAYHIRHLERSPLGTKYPAIVARVNELLATPPLGSGTPLVIDKTGVGTAVVDMFSAVGRRPYAVTITGGDEVIREGRHTKVPKRELVGTLVALFQTERLKIAAGLAEGATLVNELANFKVKVNLASGHDSYEAWRESMHDDLVLATAMACWHGERPRRGVYILT